MADQHKEALELAYYKDRCQEQEEQIKQLKYKILGLWAEKYKTKREEATKLDQMILENSKSVKKHGVIPKIEQKDP